jgi:hypothetical protein
MPLSPTIVGGVSLEQRQLIWTSRPGSDEA